MWFAPIRYGDCRTDAQIATGDRVVIFGTARDGEYRAGARDSLIVFGAPGDASGVLRGLVRSRHMTLVLALALSGLAAILPLAIC